MKILAGSGRVNETEKIPEHEAIYRRIREMILFGTLVPGQAVTIQGLVGELGAGMTPVREALRRLTAEGALATKGNRRIEVPCLGVADLEQLYFARLSIEPKMASMAANRCVADLARAMRAVDDRLNRAIANGDVEAYLKHNYRFHFLLYEAARADILLGLTRSLWLRAGPSLRIICGRFGTMNLPDNHDMAITALEQGDAEGVAHAIADDLKQGMDQVREAMIVAKVPEVD